MFSKRARASSLSAGVIGLMYIFNLLSTLQESVEELKYASLFYYYDFNAALIDNDIKIISVLTFIGVILITTVISIIVFEKRDVST